jgi:PPK2 family polyphosphate:nucleotide phosphotransferase
MPGIVDSPYLIQPGSRCDLSEMPTDARDLEITKKDARKETHKQTKRLDELQEVLYAESKHAVLIVLQAIDAGGKDSTIRKVFGRMNPQGVRVSSFKVPTPLERSHDYLWRYHIATPPKGHIGIFNRSHYESVLVERVKEIVPEAVWSKRYEQINQWEQMLASEGTLILKFYLHVSLEEQAERLRDRLVRPDKWWKFNPDDLAERERWKLYREAFDDVLTHCSTEHAPWYSIPADQKWYRNLVISEIVLKAITQLDSQYPEPEEGLEGKIKAFLEQLDGKPETADAP